VGKTANSSPTLVREIAKKIAHEGATTKKYVLGEFFSWGYNPDPLGRKSFWPIGGFENMQKSAWYLAIVLVMAIVAGCAQEGTASGEAPDAKATPKGDRPTAGAGGASSAQLAD
jgi:hypothetical protein